jgi:hypothetical protein
MYTKLHFKWLSKYFDNQNFYLTAGLTAKHIVLLTFMLGWCFLGFGQTDGCSDNIGGEITVGSSCNPTNFNSNNNTRYWTSASGCSAASNRDDAWGWFIATSTSTTIIYQPNTNDAILHLFTGTCATNMTALACADDGFAGDAETITYSTTPGTRYRVRIQRWNSNDSMSGQICVFNTPTPPGNDNCLGALPLTVNPDNICSVSTSGTTVGATQSQVGCAIGSNADDDVWFSFVASSTNHIVTVNGNSINDVVLEIFDGSCGTFSGSICIDDNWPVFDPDEEIGDIVGFIPGNTYFARVYSYGGNGNQGTFDICVTTPIITYCEPISDDPAWTYIDDIEFLGTLNDVSNNNSGFSGGYQDWTALPNAIQAQGEGVNILYQANRSSHFKAWIDWNQNNSFEDPGELVYDTGLINTPSATFGFVIPPATPPGDYRIRIRNNTYNGGSYDFNSCEDFPNIGFDFWDGEAEDYTFTVIENCNARITSVTDNDNCGPGTLTLSATSNLGGVTFNWYDSQTGGTLLFSDISGNFTTPALTTTTSYYVTAQNGCETLVRVPVTATINPVSDVTFDPPTLEACGEENAITINASGDTEIVYLIDEDFESGTLGLFQNFNNDPNGEPFDTNTQWTNQTSAYVPTNTLV